MNRNISRRVVVGGACLGGLAAAGLPRRSRAQEPGVVETTNGKLRGINQRGVLSFRGVRYGAPTGGANRFLPPSSVQRWAGVQDAAAFGDSAPQKPGGIGPLDHWYTAIQPINEDCLFLNVTTPALDAGRRPVMVWLHGGSWVNCAGTAPGFDGSELAKQGDVVVVTVNHRLNAFGYLNLGQSDSRFADAGNAGTLDLVAALQWVRDNAAAFGGDPGCVTIFGQSGGASKVTALIAMPAARGLFHRAIVQSCSGGLRLDGLEESERQAHDLATRLGLNRVDGAALQGVPMERLLTAMQGTASTFRPVLDGRNFVANPFDPTAPAGAANVPMMIGNAATEATLFMAADPKNFTLDKPEVLRRIARFLHLDAPAAGKVYDAYHDVQPGGAASDILVAVATDYMYRRNTTQVALLKAMQPGAPVYAYVYDWKTPVMAGVLRSPHTIEVPFAFGTTEAARGLLGDGPDLAALTKQTLPRWAAFARSGSPDGPGLLPWPKFDPVQRATMMLDVESHVAGNPGGQARSALDGLPFYEYSTPANYVRA